MANKHSKFMMDLAVALQEDGSYGKITNSDHPNCPDCGTKMNFHGEKEGYTKIGEGFWDCPSCGFKVTENDLDPYTEKYFDESWKY